MARPSSIEILPPDILESLQALLRDPRVSQLSAVAEINAILSRRGEPPVSKSALNRYAAKMGKAGEKLRQSREIAEMWIAKLGNAPQGKTGQLINELTRTMIFDVNLKLMEQMETGEELDLEATMGVLKDVALSVARLEKAASLNEDREKAIREEEAKKTAAKITALKGDPKLDAKTLNFVTEALYGI
jgi:hypothetical protein